MKKLMYLSIISLVFFACDHEYLKIKGEIEGLEDGFVMLNLNTNTGTNVKCIDTLQVEGGEFEFKTNTIKPPVRLSVCVNDTCEFDIYIGKYGSFDVTGRLENLKQIQVADDDLASEYYAYCNRLDSGYIAPVKSKIEWLKKKNLEIEQGVKISQDDELTTYDYEKAIRKAQSRRRMAIVKTIRTNPDSPVVMAVAQKEFKSFNTRHRAEIKKIFGRKYSDTALYWQMLN